MENEKRNYRVANFIVPHEITNREIRKFFSGVEKIIKDLDPSMKQYGVLNKIFDTNFNTSSTLKFFFPFVSKYDNALRCYQVRENGEVLRFVHVDYHGNSKRPFPINNSEFRISLQNTKYGPKDFFKKIGWPSVTKNRK